MGKTTNGKLNTWYEVDTNTCRRSPWKDALTGPFMGRNTSTAGMEEDFTFLWQVLDQMSGLLILEQFLGLLLYLTVSGSLKFYTVLDFRVVNCLVLPFSSSGLCCTWRGGWSAHRLTADGEILRRRARDTGPPEFLLPGCNSIWTVCSKWCFWFHVSQESHKPHRTWHQQYTVETYRQSSQKVSFCRTHVLFTCRDSEVYS